MRIAHPRKNRKISPSSIWFLSAVLALVFESGLHAQQPQPQGPKDLSPSPVIKSISLAGAPLLPFMSTGELWFTTWADDDNLYGAWGDGSGPAPFLTWSVMTDCGIFKLAGDLPKATPTIVRRDAPTQFDPRMDDKPSSLLFHDGRLYGHFHSPLGDPRVGYLAYSDDYGQSWVRIGFFLPDVPKPVSASPWTKDFDSPLTRLPFINQIVPRMYDNTSLRDSPFRCLFFINMGKNYELNTDGFVYGLGIGKERDWRGDVYLARVDKKRILRYSAWEYFAGLGADGKPQWTKAQISAKAVPGLYATEQGSSIYHPGVKRYLFLTKDRLFDAPEPWGPWTVAGEFPSTVPEWQQGYQPGIITKGLGENSFWFTISGQGKKPNITSSFHLGQIVMQLASPRP